MDKITGVKRVFFYLFIIIIIFCWYFLYVRGIDWGQPFYLNSDEPMVVEKAIIILKSGDYNPHFFNYPSGSIYIQTITSFLTHIYLISSGNYEGDQFRYINHLKLREKFYYYLAGRLVNALICGLSFILLFLITRYFFDPWTALVSVLSSLIFPLYVMQSHYVNPNVYGLFFILSALYCLVLFFSESSFRYLCYGAVFSGLATGCKYNLFLIFVPGLIAVLILQEYRKVGHFIFLFFLFIMAFFISTPYAVLDLPTFINDFSYEIYHYQWKGHFGAESASPFLSYLSYLWLRGKVFLLLALCGFTIFPVIVGRKKVVPALLIVMFPLIYLLFLTGYKVIFMRNLLPIIPFMGIFFAAFLSMVIKVINLEFRGLFVSKSKPHILVFVSFVLVLAGLYKPFSLSLKYLDKITKPYTVSVAQQWADDNLPAKSRVAIDKYMFAHHTLFTDEKFDVHVYPTVFFTNSMISLYEYDYLISYEQAEFLTNGIVRKKTVELLQNQTRDISSPLILSYLEENRLSLQEKLELIHRVERDDNTTGYEISFYQIPRYNSVVFDFRSFKPLKMPDFIDMDKQAVKEQFPLRSKDPVSVSLSNLEPGRYEIYIKAKAKYSSADELPILRVSCGEKTKEVKLFFLNETYYEIFPLVIDHKSPCDLELSFINNLRPQHAILLKNVTLLKLEHD